MQKISAILITLNEERNIRRCLNSIKNLVDEIIVVDSGSTDNTEKICQELNAQFIYHKMEGYGEQKNYALSLAQFDWVLSIDADEEITPELNQEIKTLVLTDNLKYDAYYLKRRHVFLGKTFYYGNESQYPIIRLFNKKKAVITNSKVHEKIIVNGTTHTFKNVFLHYSIVSIQDALQKAIKYAHISAQQLNQKNVKSSSINIFFKIPVSFFKEYIISRNFLNGYAGFVWAFFVAFGGLLKYLFLKELQKK